MTAPFDNVVTATATPPAGTADPGAEEEEEEDRGTEKRRIRVVSHEKPKATG